MDQKNLTKKERNYSVRLFLTLGKLATIPLIVSAAIPISAFEAHVINVTARIENRFCEKLDVRSMGFWKTHKSLWMFPQIIGDEQIEAPEQAEIIFDSDNNIMKHKFQKQLLTLAFNISYFKVGNAIVPNEKITINFLKKEADNLLKKNPPASDNDLETMKDRVEAVNTAGKVEICKEGPFEAINSPAPAPALGSFIKNVEKKPDPTPSPTEKIKVPEIPLVLKMLPTPEPSNSPNISPSPSPTPSPDPTPEVSPSHDPTPSLDPTPDVSPSPEPTLIPDSTPSPEPSPSPSPDPTPEIYPSPTPSPDPTPEISPTPEPTLSPDPTPEPSPKE